MSHGFISGWHLIFRQGSCSESGLPKGQGWTAGAPEAVSDKGSGSFPETESEPKCFTVLLPHLLTYSWRKALKLGWPWHYHPNWDSKSESESCSVVSDCLRSHGLYSPWNSPGQNTGSGSLSLLQGIFPTQGSNPGLPHCWWILYYLSHKGSPRILEWVAYPFFSGSFKPRNQIGVSCTAGGFFTNWAIRETHNSKRSH